MKRADVKKSTPIKDYYEGLRFSVGLTSKEISSRLGMTAVNFSNLTYMLDQMSGNQLIELSKMLGVETGKFLTDLEALRKQTK